MVMVDVTEKPEVYREATAKGIIKLRPETIQLIREGKIKKGDPLIISKIAGILAAKKTSSLIPLCHPLPLTSVEVDVGIVDDSLIEVVVSVKTNAQTGVEMEALTATSLALLTVWDVTKQYEKDVHGQYPHTFIQDIQITHKLKGSRK